MRKHSATSSWKLSASPKSSLKLSGIWRPRNASSHRLMLVNHGLMLVRNLISPSDPDEPTLWNIRMNISYKISWINDWVSWALHQDEKIGYYSVIIWALYTSQVYELSSDLMIKWLSVSEGIKDDSFHGYLAFFHSSYRKVLKPFNVQNEIYFANRLLSPLNM